MSESLREPELEPPTRVLMVIADYGPEGGGWGPVATTYGPLVYTGRSTRVLAACHDVARMVAKEEGREARVVRFTEREDLGTYPPSNG